MKKNNLSIQFDHTKDTITESIDISEKRCDELWLLFERVLKKDYRKVTMGIESICNMDIPMEEKVFLIYTYGLFQGLQSDIIPNL